MLQSYFRPLMASVVILVLMLTLATPILAQGGPPLPPWALTSR